MFRRMDMPPGDAWLWAEMVHSDLTALERLVLVALQATGDGEPVSLPIGAIARLASCSERAARSAIRTLERGGWLSVSRNVGDGGATLASTYSVKTRRAAA